MKLYLFEGETIPPESILLLSIPSQESGNAGLMAMDRLLATCSSSLTRIGTIDSHYLLPISGYEQYGKEDTFPSQLCLPLEVYRIQSSSSSSSPPFFVLHQRSICGRWMNRDFVAEYRDFLLDLKPSFLIITSGEELENMPDSVVHRYRQNVCTLINYFNILSSCIVARDW